MVQTPTILASGRQKHGIPGTCWTGILDTCACSRPISIRKVRTSDLDFCLQIMCTYVHTCPLHLVRVIISPWKPTFSDQQFNPISLLNIIDQIYTIKVESIWQKSYLKSIKIYTYTTNLCSCRE